MESSKDTLGNRTRDLPACSEVLLTLIVSNKLFEKVNILNPKNNTHRNADTVTYPP
jgi:hypothetical protein